MYIRTCRPGEPEGGEDEERACDAGEREPQHLLVAGPGFVKLLGAGEVPVPGQVEAGGEQGADADGEEGEALFAGGEVVDAGED